MDDKNGKQRAIVEVTGHKAHGPIPETGSVVIARVSPALISLDSLMFILGKKESNFITHYSLLFVIGD